MAIKYKNIVGTGFPDYVRDQLKARQNLVSKSNRDSSALQFLTNRNSFVRLSSGVLVKDNSGFTNTLAKNNVLQGGTISINNKVATFKDKFNSRYTIGATDNLGFKPTPGITNLSVGTGGRWQTLMQADIEFVCYDLDQLDTMSKLYMSLGCHVFLEWGHIPYIDNTGKLTNTVNTLDFFNKSFTETNLIIREINKFRKNSNGNYDALLGRVYNFDFTANADGTYNCKIQVMGPGQMVESLKINAFSNNDYKEEEEGETDIQTYSSSLLNALTSIRDFLSNGKNQNSPSTVKDRSSTDFDAGYNTNKSNQKNIINTFLREPTNLIGYYSLLNKIYKNCTYPGPEFPNERVANGQVAYNNNTLMAYGNAHQIVSGIAEGTINISEKTDGLSPISLNFYKGYTTLLPIEFQTPEQDTATYITLGHLMAFIQHVGIFVESSEISSEKSNFNPVVRIDYHPDNTIINRGPLEASIDPTICLIPLSIADRVVNVNNQITTLSGGNAYKQYFKPLNTDEPTYKSIVGWVLQKNNLSKNLFKKNENGLINKVNSALGKSSFEGKLFDILINLNFAISSLESLSSSKEDTTEVNLQEYLKTILDGINLSLGQVNNFRIFFDDNSNCIRIIDEIVVETENLIPEKLLSIPNYGTESTTYDYSFQSKISPNLASQIVISTQAENSEGLKEFSEDVLTYRKLNDDVLDRFAKNISKGNKNNNNTTPSSLKSLQSLFDYIYICYTTNPEIKIKSTFIPSIKNIYKELQNTQKKFLTTSYGNVLIPLEYSITIDGISGVLPYNAFVVPDNRLPKRYKNKDGKTKVAFAVFSINHNFENNQWTTTLRGQTLLINKASLTES
jgi:hypothetical protein